MLKSKLEYGSQIWSPYRLDDIDLMEYPYTERFKALEMDSLDMDSLETRSNGLKLEHEKPRLDIRKYCFSVRTAKILNQLPNLDRSNLFSSVRKIFRLFARTIDDGKIAKRLRVELKMV